MTVWLNGDGLRVYFPGDLPDTTGGEFPGAGEFREITVELDVADLTTTPAVLDNFIIVPRNSRIHAVRVTAETVAATITSVDIGLKRLNGTTELDHNGLVDQLVLASLNVAGETNTITAGGTSAGALVGTTTAYPGLLCANIAGSAGTGHLVVTVVLYVPGTDANPTNY